MGGAMPKWNISQMDWETLLNPNRRRKSTRQNTDARLEFQRDYDRSIFSTPVRRLQDKAQVFPLEPNDSVRTRLTHSHEVSCVARGIALAAIGEKPLVNLPAEIRQAIPTVAATAGLVHDLGNPPFGHAGEQAIQEWFRSNRKVLEALGDENGQMVQDCLRFEGNAQTMRLLTRLQVLNDFYGLNLTYATLSACCKYTAPSNLSPKECKKSHLKKPGYFTSENEIVEEIRNQTGTGNALNPITYMIEAADDIVYATVDLEDAISKGILSWSQVQDSLKAESHGDAGIIEILEYVDGQANPHELKLPPRQLQVTKSQIFRTSVITRTVYEVAKAFAANFDTLMAGDFDKDIVSASGAATVIGACKAVGLKHVYFTPENTKLEILGRSIIRDLLALFWEGVDGFRPEEPWKGFPNKILSVMSDNYKLVFAKAFQEAAGDAAKEQYARLQLVTDYVSGMTDTFAVSLHKSLFNE
jgi:dGTPase